MDDYISRNSNDYTFRIRLCDNEVDKDFERFPRETLEALAHLFIGKTGVIKRGCGCVPRIYRTEVVDDLDKTTKAGDTASHIEAWASIPRAVDTISFIGEIDSGIKKKVSIGLSVGKEICSVCGKELGRCHHKKGSIYDGKLCYGDLVDVKDVYEWAFTVEPIKLQPHSNANNCKSITEFEFDPVSASRIEQVVRQYPLSLQNCAELLEAVAPLAGVLTADGACKFLQEIVNIRCDKGAPLLLKAMEQAKTIM